MRIESTNESSSFFLILWNGLDKIMRMVRHTTVQKKLNNSCIKNKAHKSKLTSTFTQNYVDFSSFVYEYLDNLL